jgi:hypothetical protein
MALKLGLQKPEKLSEFQRLWLFANKKLSDKSITASSFFIQVLKRHPSIISSAKAGKLDLKLTAKEWSTVASELYMDVNSLFEEII